MAYFKKILLAVIAIMVLTMLAFYAGEIFKNYLSPEEDKFKDNLTVQPSSGMVKFHSRNGYTITYPSNWLVDASQKDAPAEFIREPGARRFFPCRRL